MDGLAGYLPLILVLAVIALGAGVWAVFRSRSIAPTGQIRVIGLGGGGSNAVDSMVRAGTRGVDYIACNTDIQALAGSAARHRLRIGQAVTRGRGAGGDPDVGRRAAEEDADRIGRALAGSELVFLTAGLGGGTGSGAAPVVARLAAEQGALTIGIVTRPFAFEGEKRRLVADEAAEELRGAVDALIVIPNDRVRMVVDDETSIIDAFAAVDDVLCEGVRGVMDIITKPGLVNLDFADVRAVLAGGGIALLGTGVAQGPDRAAVAARQAVASPLLETDIGGARSILFNVTSAKGLRLAEVTAAADAIRADADPEANVVFGASFDESLGEQVRVTVVATGLRGKTAGSRGEHAAERSDRLIAAVPAVRPAGSRRPARSPSTVTAAQAADNGNARSAADSGAMEPAREIVDADDAQPGSPPGGAAEGGATEDRAAEGPDDGPAAEGSPVDGAPAGVERRFEDIEVPSFLRRRRGDR